MIILILLSRMAIIRHHLAIITVKMNMRIFQTRSIQDGMGIKAGMVLILYGT